jgi:hypothetical protein
VKIQDKTLIRIVGFVQQLGRQLDEDAGKPYAVVLPLADYSVRLSRTASDGPVLLRICDETGTTQASQIINTNMLHYLMAASMQVWEDYNETAKNTH